MNKYYFDFNVKHRLANYYCEVTADSFETARVAITWYMGFKPAEEYGPEDNFNTEIYKAGCYASIKQRSNP